MYLIVYTGKDAKALQSDTSAEIPNTYKIQPFRTSLITATSVPESCRVQGSGVSRLRLTASARQGGQKSAGRLQLTAGSRYN
jgi:hypothetical protein